MARTYLRSEQAALLGVTFVVAFCSFAYEFVYSELLTVMYGGTVTQYVITIGLYFFALGLGSALARDLDMDNPANFTRIEAALAAAAPAGFLFIIALNTLGMFEAFPFAVTSVAARLPVVIVGLLSGFELPVLMDLMRRVQEDTEYSPMFGGGLATRAARRARGGVRALLGVVFITRDRDDEGDAQHDSERSSVSLVLAMDYLGGLAGAIIYAKVLYPKIGLISTVFALALLNALAAIVFVARFSAVGLEDHQTSIRATTGARVGVALLVLTTGCAAAVSQQESVDSAVSEFYLEDKIEDEYPKGKMQAEITYQQTTDYQRIVEYQRTWQGKDSNWWGQNGSETCLRLDSAVQMCESWADSYHSGLVDVSATAMGWADTNSTASPKDVLVVGGGDWVALNHLRQYNVQIDHVDIDKEFMQYAKENEFFASRSNKSWQSPKVNTTVGDGYTFLTQTQKNYDMIILDIPGIRDDGLLRLYSQEFYSQLSSHLKPGGVVSTWAYSRYSAPEHHRVYMSTVKAAGFDSVMPYWAYDDLDSDGDTEHVERFYLLSKADIQGATTAGQPIPSSETVQHRLATSENAYVKQYRSQYRQLNWQRVTGYKGVRPNSIFRPNYGIIVKWA